MLIPAITTLAILILSAAIYITFRCDWAAERRAEILNRHYLHGDLEALINFDTIYGRYEDWVFDVFCWDADKLAHKNKA